MIATRWRLDSKAPALGEAFRKAAPQEQRRATLTACEWVVPMVGLDSNEDVRAGLIALREGRTSEPALLERLTTLSERLDDEYLRLEEDDHSARKSEALQLFAKARAVRALAFAFATEPTQLHEAIYEAVSALIGDSTTLESAIQGVLSVQSS